MTIRTEIKKTTKGDTLVHDAARPFAVLMIFENGSRKVVNRFSTRRAAADCAARFQARANEI